MIYKKLAVAAVCTGLFLADFTVQAQSASKETVVNMQCETSGVDSDQGLYPTLTFEVYGRNGSSVSGGQVGAQFTQYSTGSNVYNACTASVQGGGARCSFEANHAAGQYYFIVSFSGYTEPNGTYDEPSSTTTSCVLPY